MPSSKVGTCALVVLLIAAAPDAFARKARSSKSLAAADGSAARAQASVSPDFEAKLKGPLEKAAQGKVDDALKSLDALIAAAASPENKALALLAAGGVAERAGRPADALARYGDAVQAVGQKNDQLADYARYFQGVIWQADPKRAADAKASFEAALRDGDLPPATELEIRARLGDLAAASKNWAQTGAIFRPLLKKLKGGELYPNALYQLYRADRRTAKACKLARELYSKYPTHPALADWGPDLRSVKVDGQRVGCAASGKDMQTRIRRLQWGGEPERAYKEIQEIRGGKVAAAGGADDGDDSEAPADEASAEDAGDDAGEYSTDSMLANYLVNEGRVDEALKLLLAHHQERRNQFGYLMLLGKAAGRAGEYASSIGAYYRAYELKPKSKDAKNALFQAAFTSYQSQDYDGASRKFEQFIKAFDGASLARDARWHLAWIRYLRGDFVGAYAGFEKLEKTKVVAHARKRRGRRQSASATLLPDAFGADRIQYWKAMCLLRQGRSAEALPLFQRLARDPAYGYYGVAAFYRLAALPGVQTTLKAELAAMKKGMAGKLSEEELRQAEEAQAQEAAIEAAADPVASPEDAAAAAAAAPAGPGAPEVPAQQAATAAAGEPNAGAAQAAIVRRFDRARALAAAGFGDHARRELVEIERRARSNEDRRALMAEYQALGNWHRASLLGETGFGPQRLRGGVIKERELWEAAYPRAFQPWVTASAKQSSIAPDLVWSIMRAESHYRQDAYSAVGAMGLMQMMPFTGKKVADLMGASKQFSPASLLQPETNIRLGARYLQRLSETFKGSVPLVAAAYNAGPHRVHAWLRSFGLLEMDEFIEHIPFVETRNYAKKVTRNYQIYGLIYGNQGRNLKWLAKPVGVAVDGPAPTREMW